MISPSVWLETPTSWTSLLVKVIGGKERGELEGPECKRWMLSPGLAEGATQEASPILEALQMWGFSVTPCRVCSCQEVLPAFGLLALPLHFWSDPFPAPQWRLGFRCTMWAISKYPLPRDAGPSRRVLAEKPGRGGLRKDGMGMSRVCSPQATPASHLPGRSPWAPHLFWHRGAGDFTQKTGPPILPLL